MVLVVGLVRSSNIGNGGAIAFDASGDISLGNANSYSNTGTGGAIALDSDRSITTENLDSHSDANAGGAITLTSTTGAISTQQLRASGTIGSGR